MLLNKYVCRECGKRYTNAWSVPRYLDKSNSTGIWQKLYLFSMTRKPIKEVIIRQNIINKLRPDQKNDTRMKRFITEGKYFFDPHSWEPFKRTHICLSCDCGSVKYVEVKSDLNKKNYYFFFEW
jgi:hypothetical protein